MRFKFIITLVFISIIKLSFSQDSTAKAILSGHAGAVNSIDVSPDGLTLISGGKDETIRIWDLANFSLKKTINMEGSSVKRINFKHDGSKFLAALYTRFAEIDFKTFKPKFSKKNTHTAFIETCLYSSDDKYILTSSWRDKTLVVWKAGSLKEQVETKEVTWVDNAIFNKGTTLIFSGGHDNLVKMWDFTTGEMVRTYAGHNDWVYDVCLSQDEKFLYSASFDNTIKIWEVNTGKNIATLKGHTEGVVCLDLSKDGKYLASGSVDKQIIIWDIGAKKEVKRIKAHDAAVIDLKFSVDNKTLYSCSQDKTIKVWDLKDLN